MIEGAIDLEDRLTLPEFANLEWRPSGTSTPSKLAMFSSADNRYSWMRTMQSRARNLPRPVGGSTRASLYRLGDLVDWVREHGEAEVIFDPGWALLRAARSFAEEQQIDPGPASRIVGDCPLGPTAPIPRRSGSAVRLRRGIDLTARKRGGGGAPGGDDLPGRLGALATRSGSGSDRLAEQLLQFRADALTGCCAGRSRRGCDARVR